jgi:hypothetical protein
MHAELVDKRVLWPQGFGGRFEWPAALIALG